jgi:hypothetical protein
VKPFCARERITSDIFLRRLSIAFEMILNPTLRREIGRQFFNSLVSPFFGIRRIEAELNIGEIVPLLKQ